MGGVAARRGEVSSRSVSPVWRGVAPCGERAGRVGPRSSRAAAPRSSRGGRGGGRRRRSSATLSVSPLRGDDDGAAGWVRAPSPVQRPGDRPGVCAVRAARGEPCRDPRPDQSLAERGAWLAVDGSVASWGRAGRAFSLCSTVATRVPVAGPGRARRDDGHGVCAGRGARGRGASVRGCGPGGARLTGVGEHGARGPP
jgi:hypothetical protein